MKVSLVSRDFQPEDAIGRCLLAQARFFAGRGDDVRIYVSPPFTGPDPGIPICFVSRHTLAGGEPEHFRLSDLYVYHYAGWYDLFESLSAIDRGTVMVHYHQLAAAGRESKQDEWLAPAEYADVHIVDSPAAGQDLVERGGYDPRQIAVLPVELGQAEYEAGLAELVSRSVPYTLPEMSHAGESALPRSERVAWLERLMLPALADEAAALSDVTVHSRIIRSGVPVLGPLIDRVRGAMTSHLRGPYLDPMIERQVSYNRRVSDWLGRAVAALRDAGERQAALEARVAALEEQVAALARRVEERGP